MPVNDPAAIRQELAQSSPFYRFEYRTVTFPATANTDIDVPHSLTPANPEAVDYEVVGKDRACDVYNDLSGARRKWNATYITLRCSVASAVVTLRLSVRRT